MGPKREIRVTLTTQDGSQLPAGLNPNPFQMDHLWIPLSLQTQNVQRVSERVES